LLAGGFVSIRRRKIAAHRACMLAALVTSTAFLTSYIIYHAQVGSVHFQSHGWIRPAYFAILTTHTILAIVILPLVIITARRALRAQYAAHRRIARWTLPLWFYVSVTGVVIYWMLYHLDRAA
jgi:putative membrane protein